VAVRPVPAGTYAVGCTRGQSGCENDEQPSHKVKLTRSVLVMETEVTQGLWESVMGTRPWEGQTYWDGKEQGPCAGAGVGPSLPVYCIDWRDAARFANALSARDGLEACYSFAGSEALWPKGVACGGWRLPTEAEWEVAARGGGDPLHAGEGPVGALAWTKENSGGRAHAVKETLANGYGLYDMSGNVWEWVWDWYGPYSSGAQVDPVGPLSGSYRVNRGGGWNNDAAYARVARRNFYSPGNRFRNLGVRLLRTAP
jgi:formylglycine-generating enzyme required for sulfatase activity